MVISMTATTCPICCIERREAHCLTDFLVLKGYPLKRCPRCGLQLLDPQPDDPTLASIYQREYYDAWGIQRDEELTRSLKHATFRRILQPIRARYSGTPRLLDCGAATGYLMEEAAELGFEPYGVELSQFGASQIAAKFGAKAALCGPFEQASFEGIDEDFF